MAYVLPVRTVSVTTTAGILSDYNPNFSGRIFKNEGAVTVYLGTASVTAAGVTQGYPVAAGAEFPDTLSNGVIYAIVAAGTADVKVWEVHS